MMNLLRSLAAHSHQGSHTVSLSPVEAKASLPQRSLLALSRTLFVETKRLEKVFPLLLVQRT